MSLIDGTVAPTAAPRIEHPQELEHNAAEWAWLLDKIAGASAVLEIGSRYGNGLRSLALRCSPGAKIRAIDHGRPDGECPYASEPMLRQTMRDLREKNYDAQALFADSHEPDSLEWAKANGPYDVVLIDGDHSYAGVRQDYEWYGPLSTRAVVLDGIAMDAIGDGVRQLWREISTNSTTQECVMSGMGIGIVINKQPAPVPAS